MWLPARTDPIWVHVQEWRRSSWRQGRAVLSRQRVSLLDNTSYTDTHTHDTDPMLVLKNAARLPGSTAFPFSIHFICILFITSIHRMGLYCQAESVEQRIRLRIAKGGLRISVKKIGTHPVLFLRRRPPGWGSGGGEVRSNGAAVVLRQPGAGWRSRRRQPRQPQSRCT